MRPLAKHYEVSMLQFAPISNGLEALPYKSINVWLVLSKPLFDIVASRHYMVKRAKAKCRSKREQMPLLI